MEQETSDLLKEKSNKDIASIIMQFLLFPMECKLCYGVDKVLQPDIPKCDTCHGEDYYYCSNCVVHSTFTERWEVLKGVSYLYFVCLECKLLEEEYDDYDKYL